jgi:hypothetical protein
LAVSPQAASSIGKAQAQRSSRGRVGMGVS